MKNPAYGRHHISQRMWIVTPIPQKLGRRKISNFLVIYRAKKRRKKNTHFYKRYTERINKHKTTQTDNATHRLNWSRGHSVKILLPTLSNTLPSFPPPPSAPLPLLPPPSQSSCSVVPGLLASCPNLSSFPIITGSNLTRTGNRCLSLVLVNSGNHSDPQSLQLNSFIVLLNIYTCIFQVSDFKEYYPLRMTQITREKK